MIIIININVALDYRFLRHYFFCLTNVGDDLFLVDPKNKGKVNVKGVSLSRCAG